MIKLGSTLCNLQDPHDRIRNIVSAYLRDQDKEIIGPSQSQVTQRGSNVLYFNYPPLPRPDINQLVIPTGATRWSYCYLLVDDDAKESIYTEAAGGPLILNYRSEYQSHRFDASGNPVASDDRPTVLMTMWPLPPLTLPTIEVNQNRTANGSIMQGCWLIPIVDERYWWQFQNVGLISEQDFSPYDSYETEAENLLNYLLDQTISTSANITIKDLHADYDGFVPDVATDNDYERLSSMLDSVSAQLGLTVVPDLTRAEHASVGTGNKFVLMDTTTSATLHTDNMSGFGTLDGILAATPDIELLGVPSPIMGDFFESEPGPMAPEKALIRKNSTEFIEVTATTAGYSRQTVTGTSVVLRYQWTADVTTALAERIATDYYSRFDVQFDRVFTGVQPFQVNAFHDCIIHRQDVQNGQMWPLTQMRSIPFNLYPEEASGGGGGGEWVEGVTENNDCPAGEIDIVVDGSGTGNRIGDTITAVDRFNVMDGQTAAELEGNVALAGRTYYQGAWIWRLWMIDSGDPCDTYA